MCDVQSQNIPVSPCPYFFRYSKEGSDIVGILMIPSPHLGKKLIVNIELSIAAKLETSSNIGNLELATSLTATYQNMMRNQPIKYRIKFSVQNPLPRIKSIMINENTICTARRQHQGTVITIARLQHVLFSQDGQQPHLSSKFELDDYDHDSDNIYNDFEKGDQNPANYDWDNESSLQTLNEPKHQQDASARHLNANSINEIQYKRYDNKISSHQIENIGSDKDICGITVVENTVPLVAGGKNVERGAWPWLVAVYTHDITTLSYQCAGSLISKRIILTAAHCMYLGDKILQADEIVLSLGRHNILKWQLDDGAIMREALLVVIHPDFINKDKYSYDADIAVIVLKTPIQYSKFIRPICLWRGPKDIYPIQGTLGKIVGWGHDPKANGMLTSEPKEIDIPIVSQEECFTSHKIIPQIASNRTFCAGRRNDMGPCNGDSGGAMAIKYKNQWTLRGIVSVAISKSNNICDLRHYVIFTDIAKLLDWILMYVNI